MKGQITLEGIDPMSKALGDEKIGMEIGPDRSCILNDSHHFQ